MAITFQVKTEKNYLGFSDFIQQYNKEVIDSIVVPEYSANRVADEELAAELRRRMGSEPMRHIGAMNRQMKMNVGIGNYRCVVEGYDQNPEIYKASLKALHILRMKASPTVYFYKSEGAYKYNAHAVGYGNNINILLSRDLIEKVMDTEEQKLFVIGHELGHNQCNGIAYGLLGKKESEFSSRLDEYSADRAGLLACQNLLEASVALMKISIGQDLELYTREFVNREIRKRTEDLLSEIEIVVKRKEKDQGSHPSLERRIMALKVFEKSEMYARCLGEDSTDKELDDRELEEAMRQFVC